MFVGKTMRSTLAVLESWAIAKEDVAKVAVLQDEISCALVNFLRGGCARLHVFTLTLSRDVHSFTKYVVGVVYLFADSPSNKTLARVRGVFCFFVSFPLFSSAICALLSPCVACDHETCLSQKKLQYVRNLGVLDYVG